ncbi:MAG: PqqD family protein [Oscillospiraceae bacterium]|nr:PqqD family protein [Oscillospiraceae bacterium]
MKLKNGFLLRQVAGQTVVLPTGNELDLNMMITLNDTGKFLWERLETETDEAALVAALLAEYDVDEATAKKAVADFVKKLDDNGFLD